MGAALAPWEGASTPAAAHPPVGMTAPLALIGPYPHRTCENALRFQVFEDTHGR